jgi:chromosome segregation ATPase
MWITCDLKINNTSTDSLGNVGYVDGSLDISNTKISDISNIKVKKHVWDSGTPIERKRLAAELQKKKNEMDVLRANDEWDINDTDELGLKANALFKHLVSEGLDVLDDEGKERLSNLKIELNKLQDEYDNVEDSELVSDLYDKITELEGDIEGLENENNDVYLLFPNRYSTYGLQSFEVLSPEFKNIVYSVGTYDEMDESALNYAKSYIDEVGVDGFNQGFIDDYIDTDYVRSYFSDWYEDDVRQNSEVYFNESDYELTLAQEERKDQLENEISEYEERQSNLDSEIEDPDEYSRMYDQIQDHIDSLQEELDNITPDDEPTEQMIEDKVESMLEDVERNPIYYIKEYGADIKDFIDENALAQGLVDSDGWGIMNSYDGQYDEVTVAGRDFYIMRVE